MYSCLTRAHVSFRRFIFILRACYFSTVVLFSCCYTHLVSPTSNLEQAGQVPREPSTMRNHCAEEHPRVVKLTM